MAYTTTFTETNLPYSRHEYFQFFATGSAASMEQSLNLGKAFQLAEIRVHLSVNHASAEYFRVWVSAGQGSAYNAKLISQIMNATTDYVWRPSTPLIFQYNDQLNLSMVLSSANVWGLTVTGWTITG